MSGLRPPYKAFLVTELDAAAGVGGATGGGGGCGAGFLPQPGSPAAATRSTARRVDFFMSNPTFLGIT